MISGTPFDREAAPGDQVAIPGGGTFAWAERREVVLVAADNNTSAMPKRFERVIGNMEAIAAIQ